VVFEYGASRESPAGYERILRGTVTGWRRKSMDLGESSLSERCENGRGDV
jgi:hypothetical protein